MELSVLSSALLQASCRAQRDASKQLRIKIHREVWAKRKCQRVLHTAGVWWVRLLWHLLQRHSQMHRGDPWWRVKAPLGKESKLGSLLSSFRLYLYLFLHCINMLVFRIRRIYLHHYFQVDSWGLICITNLNFHILHIMHFCPHISLNMRLEKWIK